MATMQHLPQAAAQMESAGRKFLDSLTGDQKARATFEYMDGERMYWYYPPINRHGLALRDMDSNQRGLAMALLESGLTPRSFEQAKQIIEHEDVLGPLEKEMGMVTFVRDTEPTTSPSSASRGPESRGAGASRAITSRCISAYGAKTSSR